MPRNAEHRYADNPFTPVSLDDRPSVARSSRRRVSAHAPTPGAQYRMTSPDEDSVNADDAYTASGFDASPFDFHQTGTFQPMQAASPFDYQQTGAFQPMQAALPFDYQQTGAFQPMQAASPFDYQQTGAFQPMQAASPYDFQQTGAFQSMQAASPYDFQQTGAFQPMQAASPYDFQQTGAFQPVQAASPFDYQQTGAFQPVQPASPFDYQQTGAFSPVQAASPYHFQQTGAFPLITPFVQPDEATNTPKPRRHRRSQSKPQADTAPPDIMPISIVQAPPSNAPDPWEAMGWKGTSDQPNDRVMFERDAFSSFPNPHEYTPDGHSAYAPEPTDLYADAFSADGGEARTADAATPPSFASAPKRRAAAADPQVASTSRRVNAVRQPARAAKPSVSVVVPPPSDLSLEPPEAKPRTSPWHFVLTLCCTLSILFCLIEGGRIALNLLNNESDMKTARSEYYAREGVSLDANASRVELLPAGQTYPPTATPVVEATATPVPRIAQNDPLIGVIDGNAATTFEAALPTPTAATRTKLTRYEDNPLSSVSEQFTELLAENPDVIGRLTIDGVLDETIVQRNNTFYLTHNALGTMGSSGAIFADQGCSLRIPPENLLLRGQTTSDGKLFSQLKGYVTGGADFVRSHIEVSCSTLYEDARYVVFAVLEADNRANAIGYFNFVGHLTFTSDQQLLNYVESARARSLYDIGVDVAAADRLLTLATLTEDGGSTSLVVLCRKLRAGETATSISVVAK